MLSSGQDTDSALTSSLPQDQAKGASNFVAGSPRLNSYKIEQRGQEDEVETAGGVLGGESGSGGQVRQSISYTCVELPKDPK